MRHGVLAVLWLLCWLRLGAAAERAPIPPGEDSAKERLNTSSRHGEFVSIDATGGPVRTWVVHPERSDKAPVVIVIHEIFGLTDWVRAVADQLAADGFIAVAPDLLSGNGANGGGTEAFSSRDDAVQAVSSLPREQVLSRLGAVRGYALGLKAGNGRIASIGFCWGGMTSFAYAATEPSLDAAVVYYGPPPTDVSAIKAPVIGFYGGNDERVDATIEPTKEKMKSLGKSYEPHVYEGAGHGFLRAQSDEANRRASEQAWPATLAFLRAHTR